MPNHDLRQAREDAGLTQADLAARAGVSRQLVGAAEAARHAPSVETALRIARALDTSVEALFSASAGAPEGAERMPDGTPVALARVGERTVAHALGSLVAGDGAWAAPDGVVEKGAVRALGGGTPGGFAVMGCDPVLGLCAALLGAGDRRLVPVPGSTGSALAALAAGRVHAALVHGPDGGLPPEPEGVVRLHVARWRVGVGAPRGATSLEPLLDAGQPMIQREDSAASQQALSRAAGDRLPPASARATGHVDAARRAALTGAAAVTFEPAARHHGLAFIPLETHLVELWVDERWMEHPGAAGLARLLGADGFRARLDLVGGYDLEGSGSFVRAA